MSSIKNTTILARARAGLSVSIDCPECGNTGPHDVNDDHAEPMACCNSCGEHFDVLPFISCRDCDSLAEDNSRYCRSCGPRRAGEALIRRGCLGAFAVAR